MQQEEKGLRSAASIALLALVLASAPVAAAPIEGDWTIDTRENGDHIELGFKRSWNRSGSHGAWSSTSDFERSQVRGLPAGKNPSGAVSLSLVRESGTIRMEGRMDDGRGGGRFTFEADQAFVADLKRAGFREVDDEQMLRVCVHDLDREWIRDTKSLGLRDPTLDGLLRLRSHDVTADFVRGLTAAGYSNLSVDEVVRLQSHGVTADYVRGLGKTPKQKPSVEEIVRFKSHGLEPSYVSALSRYFEPEEMVRLYTHGVSADYVREFRALGYQSASAEDFVRLQTHGVSPEFARRAQELHGKVTTEELIKLKMNGVE